MKDFLVQFKLDDSTMIDVPSSSLIPQRGVDYWTEEDKEAIIQEVLKRLTVDSTETSQCEAPIISLDIFMLNVITADSIDTVDVFCDSIKICSVEVN